MHVLDASKNNNLCGGREGGCCRDGLLLEGVADVVVANVGPDAEASAEDGDCAQVQKYVHDDVSEHDVSLKVLGVFIIVVVFYARQKQQSMRA